MAIGDFKHQLYNYLLSEYLTKKCFVPEILQLKFESANSLNQELYTAHSKQSDDQRILKSNIS